MIDRDLIVILREQFLAENRRCLDARWTPHSTEAEKNLCEVSAQVWRAAASRVLAVLNKSRIAK